MKLSAFWGLRHVSSVLTRDDAGRFLMKLSAFCGHSQVQPVWLMRTVAGFFMKNVRVLGAVSCLVRFD